MPVTNCDASEDLSIENSENDLAGDLEAAETSDLDDLAGDLEAEQGR